MIPLDSKRWAELTVWSGDPQALPSVLREWRAAIGLPAEETIYGQRLHEKILHQGTIVNSAFAVLPYVVDVCESGRSSRQIEYLADVALIEARRLHNGVNFHKDNSDPYPDWLMHGYRDAIARSCNLADDAIESEANEERKHALVALKPALHGNAELAFRQW